MERERDEFFRILSDLTTLFRRMEDVTMVQERELAALRHLRDLRPAGPDVALGESEDVVTLTVAALPEHVEE